MNIKTLGLSQKTTYKHTKNDFSGPILIEGGGFTIHQNFEIPIEGGWIYPTFVKLISSKCSMF